MLIGFLLLSIFTIISLLITLSATWEETKEMVKLEIHHLRESFVSRLYNTRFLKKPFFAWASIFLTLC